ncbi:hypothetical protein WN944_027235 [Citrus x changshan-huyou]|uniref:Uncharacterized protein n=1 Tax=Citrus x changshan-huyou TaxID=2935761 RepID=A0AAP0LNE2_9ROSI
MTAKCTEQGEAGQSAFDDSNACSTQARHPAFDDCDCEADGVQFGVAFDFNRFEGVSGFPDALASGSESARIMILRLWIRIFRIFGDPGQTRIVLPSLYSGQLGHWDMEEMVVVGRLCWTEQSIAYDEEHEKQFQQPSPLELRMGNLRIYPERRREVFRNMGAIKWATFEVPTSLVQEMTPMPILFGEIIATCARMANDNKWRRANVKKPYNQNQNYSQLKPWEDAFQNLKNLTHSTIEQQNRTIDKLRNEMRADFNSQAQSVSNLKKMVGQLASLVQTLTMIVEKRKFPSQPVPNPKGVHRASTSSPQQHGEVKAIMTLRKRKKVNNKVEMPVTKMNQIVPVNVEDSSLEEKEETNPREYVLKAPFPQRLAKGKKGKSTSEILEPFA